jgi:hypothetical protein
MKITTIRIEAKNCPDPMYSSIVVGATAIVDDEDNANECATKLGDFIDWHTKKSTRDAQYRDYLMVLEDENSSEDAKLRAHTWIQKYEARKALVESM